MNGARAEFRVILRIECRNMWAIGSNQLVVRKRQSSLRGLCMLNRIRRAIFRMRHKNSPFPGSAEYWERRYRGGGNSGDGSYGGLAEFKAETINAFVAENGIQTVVELGCGDGNQLGLMDVPQYTGYDISKTAVEMCAKMYASDASKNFVHYLPDQYDGVVKGQLSLSLDIIFHLVEDDVFETYMRHLFQLASDWVIVYSSNSEEADAEGIEHCRNRKFVEWVDANISGWDLVNKIENRYPERSISDFYFYKKSA
jgi:hypothetical protein